MLTELLLEVTSEEMEAVAREVYHKEKAKRAKGTYHFTIQTFFKKLLMDNIKIVLKFENEGDKDSQSILMIFLLLHL